MQSRGARIVVVLVAVAAVVVLFLVLRDDGGEEETTTPAAEQPATPKGAGKGGGDEKPKPEPKPEVATAEIEVKGGAPVGGVQDIEFAAGEKAKIVVSSPDTTEEVHLHGYDIEVELAPGEPAEIEFDATIEGVFEVELEESATEIAELTVSAS